MLGWKPEWRYARGCSAVVLSLFLLIPALLPLAPQRTPAATMACCRTKAKCCCRKSGGSPAFSAKTCRTDCGRVAFFVTSAMAGIPMPVHTAHPVTGLSGRLTDRSHTRIASLTAHSLHQRPPPHLLAA
jgi:hypothetical protein